MYIYKIYKNYCFPNESCRKKLNFTFKASNSKFQAETIASFRQKNWNKDIKIGGMSRF